MQPFDAKGLFTTLSAKQILLQGHSDTLATGVQQMWIPPVINSYGEADLTIQLRDDPSTYICDKKKCENAAAYWKACWEKRDDVVFLGDSKCPGFKGSSSTKVTGRRDKLDENLGKIVAVGGLTEINNLALNVKVRGFAGDTFPPGGTGKCFCYD